MISSLRRLVVGTRHLKFQPPLRKCTSADDSVNIIDREGGWYLSDEQIDQIWDEVSDTRVSHPTPYFAERLAELMIKAQKEKLRTIIKSKEACSDSLEESYLRWIPRWKQWGVTVHLDGARSEKEAAEGILDHLTLHRDDLVEQILDNIGAIPGCSSATAAGITRNDLKLAVREGAVEMAEKEDFKEASDSGSVTSHKK